MNHLSLRSCIGLILLASLFSACAGPADSPSNSNASEQTNSNSAAPTSASNGTPLAVQPTPAVKAAEDAAKPAEKQPPASDGANASTAKTERVPKLVVPAKKVDFGKQPKDKTIFRAISIRNGGRANLNIESVTPG